MQALSNWKKITGILLCASLTGALFSGCKKGDDTFPSIDYEVDQPGQSEVSEETHESAPGNEIRELTVALPYSDETIRCLASMFYCKNSGIWDSTETGLTVDIDYLSSVATNYVIANESCESTGASLETVRSWKNNAPDLFLAQDSEAVWQDGKAAELNAYLSDNEYLNSQQIYAGALSCDSDNGAFYALPHFCSAEILMGSYEFIPTNGGKLQTKNTTEDLRNYLEQIREEYSSCAGFASAYELIPYLGAAFNNDMPSSYMLHDEYSKNRENATGIIDDATDYVRGFYDDSLAHDQIGGADPVYSRTAALWADSSANVKAWSEYYPNSLYLLHLPCSDASNAGVPYISTYSLCVSKSSADKEFAAEFAAFISYDPDAQLLLYRLEDMSGLMPLTRNEAVWDLISEDELFGHMASDFRQTMDNAVYCPASNDNAVYMNTNEYLAEFVKGNDEFDPEKCYG